MDLADDEADEDAQEVPRIRNIVLQEPADKNTLRVLIATDNHLGYCEKDPIRNLDSFRTFDEIFQIAVDNQVDMVLLGGDLFHDNKPSRSAYYKCCQTLRKYCLGNQPVRFEVLSDQKINFPDTGCVNYEDANYNICLPVFAIHGNHDDPAGRGGFSAMDLLNKCALLNYFGKAMKPDAIENYPILLAKGSTKVALYGMGNIRDERLHRTFMDQNVRWVRPAESKDDWFNLCVIHQNRVRHSSLQKNWIADKMLPNFLDMVIWAHEHDCVIDPEESVEGGFFVSQPGSSVATSLSRGESVTKKVGILEICGERYRMVPVPLKTVRPFLMNDVCLQDELDPLDNTTEDIEHCLEEKVRAIIEELAEQAEEGQEAVLPLIRLRVDHTGFPKLHIQRFGQRFVGKVANPDELLLFHRQKLSVPGSKGKGGIEDADAHFQFDVDETPPIGDIVTAILEEGNESLSILSTRNMARAMQAFVDKKDASSIESFVTESLEKMQIDLRRERIATLEDIHSCVKERHDKTEARERAEADQQAAELARAALSSGGVASSGAVAVRGAGRGVNGDAGMALLDDERAREDSEEDMPAPRRGTRTRTSTAKSSRKTRTRAKVEREDSEEEEDREVVEVDSEEEGQHVKRSKSQRATRAKKDAKPAREKRSSKAPAKKRSRVGALKLSMQSQSQASQGSQGGSQQSQLSFTPQGSAGGRSARSQALMSAARSQAVSKMDDWGSAKAASKPRRARRK